MKLAFVFPGQGSQSVGMMSGFSDIPVVQETFAQASDVLGEDLWAMAESGPAEVLSQTTVTQPLMLVAGIAVLRAWQEAGGPAPQILAGHSLGEYSALVAAESLSFKDAVAFVRFRAQCMQDAVPPGTGAMAAILGLDENAVREACAQASTDDEIAEAANLNTPQQIVVAGHKAAVERTVEAAKSKGAKRAMLLKMSAPSHCVLMQPASDRLQPSLNELAILTPKVPVLHNADVAPAGNPDEVRDALSRQLVRPVRWVETIRKFVDSGVTHIVECGPGKVLVGLNKRIGVDATSLALVDSGSLQDAISAVRT